MKGFFYGLGLGVALGVLFAPMSGEETRNNLAERAGDLGDNARDLAGQAKQTYGHGVEKAKNAYSQGAEKVRSGVKSIRGQASDTISDVKDSVNQATGTDL